MSLLNISLLGDRSKKLNMRFPSSAVRRVLRPRIPDGDCRFMIKELRELRAKRRYSSYSPPQNP